jgi:hypothetical protein
MIDLIYKTLLTITNKENFGYVSPTEFNLLANNVQSEIYRGYFEDDNLDKNRENRGLTNKGYGNLSFNQRQRLAQFSKISDSITGVTGGSYNAYVIPSDLYFIEDDGVYEASSGTVIEEVARSKAGYLLKSEVAPSSISPIYERYGTIIRVYPASIGDIQMRYLREPLAPNWTYEVVTAGDGSTVEMFDSSNSSYQDFELHASEFSNIVIRMLSSFGINLREGEVIQIAETLKDKMNLKDSA